MYTVVKLTDTSTTRKQNKKKRIRIVVTPYFQANELLNIIDLVSMVKTTNIKVKQNSGTTSLLNSIFSAHANKYAILQEIDDSEYNYILSHHSNLGGITNAYLIIGNKKLLMTILTDRFVDSLKKIMV